MNGEHSGLTSANQKSFEQNEYNNKVASNESSLGFLVENTQIKNDFSSFPKNISKDKQGKHILGHKNYKPGKSYLSISMSEAQRLIKKFSGKGKAINTNKERVNFDKVIGIYVDQKTGKKSKTTVGIIHYSKSGTHIVPARPKED